MEKPRGKLGSKRHYQKGGSANVPPIRKGKRTQGLSETGAKNKGRQGCVKMKTQTFTRLRRGRGTESILLKDQLCREKRRGGGGMIPPRGLRA